MEHVVIDSSVLVAYLLESDEFHQRSRHYVDGLEKGDYTFHLPMLVAVEVMASVSRRPQGNRLAIINAWQRTLLDWESDGKAILYPLDRNRMDSAVNIAQRHRLRGSDAVIAALAEELGMPLRTFDTELQQRFHQAPV
jgi:predicted nucleic acid-binding protein